MTQFAASGLSPAILRALRDEGYTTPTPIQVQAIGPALEGRDLLGCAQTGTGKTAAFALPILHRLAAADVDKGRRGATLPRVLVLSPTRELATQIGESFATYGRHTHLSHTVIFGGVSQFHQVKALRHGVDILVATPGRLLDLMEQRLVNLSAISVFILDEADRMLDMGFIKPIREIAAALPKPGHRQTLLFSATMPKEIMHLADSLLHDPVKVTVKPVAETTALIEQSLYMVQKARKTALLLRLLAGATIERALVFTRTKRGADRLSSELNHSGIACDAIHGNKAQNQRRKALDGFRSGGTRVLVATDVAARGLDVDGITHVVNYDLPLEPEAYVHRIGRTGRAGASGMAISFCDTAEQDLLRAIEKLIGKRVPLIGPPAAPSNGEAPRREHRPVARGPQRESRPSTHRDQRPPTQRESRPTPHAPQRESRPSTHAPQREARPAAHGAERAPHTSWRGTPRRPGRAGGARRSFSRSGRSSR